MPALALLLASCGAPTMDAPDTPDDLAVRAPMTIVALAPTTAENARPGTSDWRLTDEAKNGEISGYASATSINRGESIDFSVSTDDAMYTLDVFRMGWYGGLGGRRMQATQTLPGERQTSCPQQSDTRMIQCRWHKSYTLTVPNDPDRSHWASGYYLAKLSGTSTGKQSYIVFVVRDDARPSEVLMQAGVTTYQAYNAWGGTSLYSKPRAVKVSFDRPYARGAGAGDFFYWEYGMLRFLEREGYDVTYSTNIDTHMHRPASAHKLLLIAGHDEYWSWEMRNHVKAARDAGMNLAFFAANIGYWQIRLEDGPEGAPNRVQVCYKHPKPYKDPYASHPDHTRFLTTTLFRRSPVNRPEAKLVGVMHQDGDPADTDYQVVDPTSWVFEKTGLRAGDLLKGVVGYETDAIAKTSPANVHVVAHAEFMVPKNKSRVRKTADAVTYVADSGATVFAAGSLQWSWGLDQLGEMLPYHPNRSSEAVMQVTRNVLSHAGVKPH
jgi:hypothetical protein